MPISFSLTDSSNNNILTTIKSSNNIHTITAAAFDSIASMFVCYGMVIGQGAKTSVELGKPVAVISLSSTIDRIAWVALVACRTPSLPWSIVSISWTVRIAWSNVFIFWTVRIVGYVWTTVFVKIWHVSLEGLYRWV